MKKIILLSLLLSSLAYAESKIYLGVGYGYSNAHIELPNSGGDETTNSSLARIKIGYGMREAYAAEFSLDYIDSDPEKYAFDIALIKAFDWGIYVNPFVKAGFGAGVLEATESLTYGSFNLGTGLYIPMGENYDIELSYEYQNRSYEKANTESTTESRVSNVNILYIGINARF